MAEGRKSMFLLLQFIEGKNTYSGKGFPSSFSASAVPPLIEWSRKWPFKYRRGVACRSNF
jgi:hypothetical protein